MFGHRWYGARYYGPRYWGDGGTVAPPEPAPQFPPSGAAIRARLTPRETPEVVHASITVTASGQITVIGHKAVEYPPDDEVMTFLGMI